MPSEHTYSQSLWVRVIIGLAVALIPAAMAVGMISMV